MILNWLLFINLYELIAGSLISTVLIKNHSSLFLFICLYGFTNHTAAQTNLLLDLESPIIFKGDDTTAYRDPAVLYHNQVFYLFFTLVMTEGGKIYSYTAESHSVDLKNWSAKKILTPERSIVGLLKSRKYYQIQK